MKKIVYVVGGLLNPNGMSAILSQKINYLAEHTDYDLYMILTEKAGEPWYYQIHSKVRWVNFNINFDELDTMPLYKKIPSYFLKIKKYRKRFADYLMQIKPDITISTIRREINFINTINDGSKKIGELHFCRPYYRQFQKKYLPTYINQQITNYWSKSLIRKLNKLDMFVLLTQEDYNLWPEIDKRIVIPNFISYHEGNKSVLNQKKAIAVGRYTEQKGFDLLIKAWSIVGIKHPDWQLNIFGSGDRQYYQQLVDSMNLNTKICCNKATNNIYEEFRNSSFFVLSSRFEGFGLVIVEAMSVGLPVVSYACPCGPSDIITHKKDGILVEKENINKLAEGICFLIENEKERKEYGEKAFLKAHMFSQEIIMDKWINLFDQM